MATDATSAADEDRGDRGRSSSGATLDRTVALRRFDESRRLFALALLVHERSDLGRIDSAPLATKSVRLLLTLLLEMHGIGAPAEFESLVERSTALAHEQGMSLAADDIDFLLVERMDRAFDDLGAEIPVAESRRYHRAIVRLKGAFDDLADEIDALYPPTRSFRRRAKAAAFFGLGLATGLSCFLLFRKPSAVPTPPSTARASSSPGSASVPAARAAAPGFSAVYFRDTQLAEMAFERRDESVDFNWASDAPQGLTDNDHFSVRWKGNLFVPSRGFYDFYLTSDDGSRLFIDEQPVVDNWGGHSVLTKDSRVELNEGVHPITVEYFDDVGEAVVRLEWAHDGAPRKVLGGDDLR